MQFFPQVEQIRQALDAQRARPSEWRETNLTMLREFASKMAEAGVEAPHRISYAPPETPPGWTLSGLLHGHPDLQTTHHLRQEIYLSPGPPPHFWVHVSKESGDLYAGWTDVTNRVELEDLEELALWNPRSLHDQLYSYLPQ